MSNNSLFQTPVDRPRDSDKVTFLNLRILPGKVDYRRAGYILDMEPVAIQKLVALGHLKPLGNNAGTEHKYFLTQTILQCAHDAKWMDKAMRALQSHWAEKNSRRKALNPSRVRRKLERPVAVAA
ncbi:MAG TPA: hypothetical protein VL981_02225 [Candidatus Methylacidiphilales bacterium]|nr:hypothetical protein [Candidatus Methylacidiphilales bacterium]